MDSSIISSKKGFEMTFGMLFALIAGAIILIVSIYAAIRIIGSGQQTIYSESALSLGNMLNPVVNGITNAYSDKIPFRRETRIYLGCYETSKKSIFGRETLAFSEESGFIQKWTKQGANISRYNKYIFAEEMIQGKSLYIFSKPIYAGFRVDDAVILSMSNYCFIGAPDFIKEEISGLAMKNVNITPSTDLCPANSYRVCFGFSGGKCNASVTPACTGCDEEYETGYVTKGKKQEYYYGSLIYSAIFSSPEIYECNVNRLGTKISELAEVYIGKINIVKEKNCGSVIEPNLNQLRILAKNLTSSKLMQVYLEAKRMDEQNCDSDCRIYNPESC